MGVIFKAKKMFITIDDPEEAEQFLRGLIVAKSNNSSPYFEQLIDGVNSILEPWRQAVIEGGIDAKPASKIGVVDDD